MNHPTGLVSTMKNRVPRFAYVLAACALATLSQAQVVLNDGNSQTSINLGGGSGALGMNSWTINGVNQLAQQWFWIGAGGAAQAPINTLGALSYSATANYLTATYVHSQFNVRLDYQLSGGLPGGNDGTSDVTETISIQNTTANPITFRFFQYSDFNLLGSGAADSVNITSTPPPPTYWRALQTAGGTALSETVDSPFANHAEAAYAGSTLLRLNSGAPITLNDNLSAGPGDVTWAFEWDFTLAGGETFDVLKDKRLSVGVVPEPTTVSLLALGLLGFVLRRQR
jgi:hypothetical protein